MNPKKIRYYLLAGVLTIWGLIIFRIVKGLDQDAAMPPVKKIIAKLKLDDPQDSFTLFANYPDPFIKANDDNGRSGANAEIPFQNNPVTNIRPVLEKPRYDFSTVVYRGMINNQVTKKKIAFISVAGKDYTVKEGDIIESLKIRKITGTQIIVFAEGKSSSIMLKK